MNVYDVPDPCMEASWWLLESMEASGLETSLSFPEAQASTSTLCEPAT